MPIALSVSVAAFLLQVFLRLVLETTKLEAQESQKTLSYPYD